MADAVAVAGDRAEASFTSGMRWVMWAMLVRLVASCVSHVWSSYIGSQHLFGAALRDALVVHTALRWLASLALGAALVGLLLAASVREARRSFALAATVCGLLVLAELTFTFLMTGSLLALESAAGWARLLFPVAVHLEPCLDIAFLAALIWALGTRAGFRQAGWRWTTGLTAIYLMGLILRVWMPVTQAWFKEHVWWRAGVAIATMALSGAALLWLLRRLSRPVAAAARPPSGA